MAKKEEREALLGIAVGKKGVGKTYKTLETMQPYLRGNAATGAKPRKVLILDVNNEFGNVRDDQNPAFQHIKAINVEHVKRFTHHPLIEARRVTILKEGGGTKSMDELFNDLTIILNDFQNGLLLIEDWTKIIADSISNQLISAIVTQRHKSVDIITHFQSIGKAAHPQLFANCNYIRMHKCDDYVKRHKDKFGGEITHLYILEKMVAQEYAKGNTRFCAYLDKDDGKLKGDFSLQMFKTAVEGYMQDNYTQVVEAEVKRKDIHTGRPIYAGHKQAVDFLMKEYIKDFYGNMK